MLDVPDPMMSPMPDAFATHMAYEAASKIVCARGQGGNAQLLAGVSVSVSCPTSKTLLPKLCARAHAGGWGEMAAFRCLTKASYVYAGFQNCVRTPGHGGDTKLLARIAV